MHANQKIFLKYLLNVHGNSYTLPSSPSLIPDNYIMLSKRPLITHYKFVFQFVVQPRHLRHHLQVQQQDSLLRMLWVPARYVRNQSKRQPNKH